MNYILNGFVRYLSLLSLVTFIGALQNVWAAAEESTITRLAPLLDKQSKISKKDKGAEVLYSIHTRDIDSKGLYSARSYYSIRINDQESARDYGRIQQGYNHYYFDAELEFANVRSADGVVLPVDKSAVQKVKNASQQDFYDDSSSIVFSLPRVEPGAIIEFQFKIERIKHTLPRLVTDRTDPYWFQPRVGGDSYRADPVHKFYYRRSRPETMTLNNKTYGEFPRDAVVVNKDGVVTETWKAKNLAKRNLEGSMVPDPDRRTLLRSSTLADWKPINDWSWEKFEQKSKPTKKIRELASKITKNTQSEDEAIRAIYAYVQKNIRYVYAHLGRGGYDPHYAEKIIQNRYGDCKDQTTVILALLGALNIEAYPALVQTPYSGKEDTSIPTVIFDHVLVWIAPTESREGLYVDTTGDHTLFPGVTQYLDGQPTLVLNGDGGKLIRFESKGDPSVSEIKLSYHLSKNRKLKVNADILYQGVGESFTRSWWTRDNQRDTNLYNTFNSIFPGSNDHKLDVEVKNEDELFKPISLHGRFDFPKLDDETTSFFSMGVSPIVRVFGLVSELQLPDTRKTDLYIPYDRTYRLVSEFRSDENKLPVVSGSADDISMQFFTVKQSASKIDQGYRVEIELSVPAATLTPSQYKQFYEDMNAIVTSPVWEIGFVHSKKQDIASRSLEVKEKNVSTDLQKKLALVQSYIDKGDFALALAEAKLAVKDEGVDSPTAWYLLGMAYGLSGNVDESNHAFSKAQAMGYTPSI